MRIRIDRLRNACILIRRHSHWHRVAEWGYILNGTGRISAIDEDGRSFISDVKGPINGSDPDIY